MKRENAGRRIVWSSSVQWREATSSLAWMSFIRSIHCMLSRQFHKHCMVFVCIYIYTLTDYVYLIIYVYKHCTVIDIWQLKWGKWRRKKKFKNSWYILMENLGTKSLLLGIMAVHIFPLVEEDKSAKMKWDSVYIYIQIYV